MAKKKKIQTPQQEHKALLAFTRLLAAYDCAGCEPPSVDIATGKREGGLCGPCAATDWLIEHGYQVQR